MIEQHIEALLHEIEGSNELRDGIKETPQRVARMYKEIFGGYSEDPKALLSKTFDKEFDVETTDIHDRGMVLVKDIEFYSHCEHHMVPFYGTISIGYIPKKRVVGISKLARVAMVFAKRLQIQERLTEQIAKCIEDVLDPVGVMVVIKAKHLCMAMRGVKNPSAETVTSCVRGLFIEPEVRAEFLSLVK